MLEVPGALVVVELVPVLVLVRTVVVAPARCEYGPRGPGEEHPS